MTCKDFDLADDILGQDIATLKLKAIKRNTSKLLHKEVFIPEELILQNLKIHLSIDTMYVNGVYFFNMISHVICYRTTQFKPNRKAINF